MVQRKKVMIRACRFMFFREDQAIADVNGVCTFSQMLILILPLSPSSFPGVQTFVFHRRKVGFPGSIPSINSSRCFLRIVLASRNTHASIYIANHYLLLLPHVITPPSSEKIAPPSPPSSPNAELSSKRLPPLKSMTPPIFATAPPGL